MTPTAGAPGGAGGVPANARDQVARLLTLVPMLHAHGTLRLAEAADLLGTTPDQVLADLKVLFLCGLPGGYPDDLIDVDLDALESEEGELRADGLIRVSNADYLGRPLRLTATEASAMIVALRGLREGSPAPTAAIVDRVLAKLEQAASGVARPGADGVDGAVDLGVDLGEPERLAREAAETALAADLERAVRDRRQVRLRYFNPTRDEVTERVVDPRGLVSGGAGAPAGQRYLDAWCHSAEAPRWFRLDRIDDAAVLDAPIRTDPTGPRSLAAGLFEQSPNATTATVRLARPARWVVEYYPVEDVRPAADGTEGAVDVDLLVADPAWLLRLLLRLAPHARVLAPEEFTERFTEAAQRTLGLYP